MSKAKWGGYKTVDVGDVEVYVELDEKDIAEIVNEHGKDAMKPQHDELREAVAAIRDGQPRQAIFSLQRAFAHDSAMVELIETEWGKK